MKKICLSLSLLFCFITAKTQSIIYFDKRFKRVESLSKARYRALTADNFKPSLIQHTYEIKAYAEGFIYPADTLTFDGKVIMYGNERTIKTIRYYKKGEPEPLVMIDAQLVKTNKPTPYFLAVNEKGDFFAFRKANPNLEEKNDVMIASGKLTDTVSMNFDGDIMFYNDNGEFAAFKKYKNGKEIPFIMSTIDYKEPYDILNVITYHGGLSINMDAEMEAFIMKCKKTGADGVIGIKTTIAIMPSTEFSNERTDLIIQGTTIRLKNKTLELKQE